MRVIYMEGDKAQHQVMNDDTQFILNEPHGFVRIIEKGVDGQLYNWYFNMQNIIALGPGK